MTCLFLAPVLLAVVADLAMAQDYPSAEITNGAITAKLYLPDPERGYYRGTRFDWSGVIHSLRTRNHEYFGQWFPRYDPKLHDAIMGPVEEFRFDDGGLGFAEAKAGGSFIRIGVGVVRRPDEKPYQGFHTYEIVDPGRWLVQTGRDRVRFTHHLRAPNGYAYRYVKTIRLVKNQPRMIIEHEMKNLGTRLIRTSQYNHNFFVIDGQQSGPDTRVKFPFDLKARRAFAGNLAEVSGGEIRYLQELKDGESVFGEFHGNTDAGAYDVHVENRKTGAGVRIRGDRPLSKVVYWSIRTVFSPEPYIDLEVAPKATTRWTYTYDFFGLNAAR